MYFHFFINDQLTIKMKKMTNFEKNEKTFVTNVKSCTMYTLLLGETHNLKHQKYFTHDKSLFQKSFTTKRFKTFIL